MKNYCKYISGALVLLFATACNEEPFSDGGEGYIILHPTVNTDIKVITRADNQELSENLMIWISNEKGLVRRYESGSDVPNQIPLVSGAYVAEGWAGDSVPASFDQIWYKGMEAFEVKKGETTTVNLTCKVANVAVSVKYDENIPNVLSNPILVVGHQNASLTFGEEEAGFGEEAGKRGYFMMPSYDKDLAYTLTGTQINGKEFSFSGVIENAKPGTEYVMHVTCEEKTNDVGGAIFTIKIDENEIQMDHTVELISAPKIQGYDFDINGQIVAEQGQVGRRCVYVASATTLNSIVLESDIFRSFDFNGEYPDLDLLKMNEEFEKSLADKGINYKNLSEDPNESLIQINFEAALLNSLPLGNHTISIKVVDKNGRISNAVMKIMVSDASVVTESVNKSSISFTTATLRGTITREGVSSIGFKYRRLGQNDWISVEGHTSNGSMDKDTEYYAELTGLNSSSTYEYYAVAGDFESQVVLTFTTNAHAQLPNAGFEEWSLYNNKVQIPALNYTDFFWDTGNHGATLIGSASDNITTPNSDLKHGGKYSACLKTKYVMVKLAAGNIFSGKFLGRVNVSDGATGFGRPFTETPKSVKLWVKYIPGSQKYRNSKTNYLKGGHDEGQIFIALTDKTTDTFNNEQWPFVVNTGTAKYFTKDDPRVIAYGEHIFESATEGDGLIELEIPIQYFREETPSNIIFVASSSRYGDYFEGYDDSTLYLDDIQLIYGDEYEN